MFLHTRSVRVDLPQLPQQKTISFSLKNKSDLFQITTSVFKTLFKPPDFPSLYQIQEKVSPPHPKKKKNPVEHALKKSLVIQKMYSPISAINIVTYIVARVMHIFMYTSRKKRNCHYFSMIFFFFFSLTLLFSSSSGQAVVVIGVVPSPPRFLAFNFYRTSGVQQSHCSSIFHRVFLLTHALSRLPQKKSICARGKVPTNLYEYAHSVGLGRGCAKLRKSRRRHVRAVHDRGINKVYFFFLAKMLSE